MDRSLLNLSNSKLFPSQVNLHFDCATTVCSCGNSLHIYKTKKRRISTLLIGDCNALISELWCKSCKKIYSPEELTLMVPKGSHFCFDIIVYIGMALFLEHRNDEEIQKALQEKNISISLREISYLGNKFIVYLALTHRDCQGKVKQHMWTKGGYILHLDGTCEGNSPHLFSFIDELSRIVLDNIKIPSENSSQIKLPLEEIKKIYGEPIALVHDMSSAIIGAVSCVFPNVKDFICHLHFLRDLGKDLFSTEYNSIRRSLKAFRVRPALRKIARELKEHIEQNEELKVCLNDCMKKDFFRNIDKPLMPLVAFYLLVLWVLESKNKSHGYGFPFDRPHVDFCDRLKEAYPLMKDLKRESAIDAPKISLVKLNRVLNDTSLNNSLKLIKNKISIFDELRNVMRIVATNGTEGLNDDGSEIEIKTIEAEVKKFRDSEKIVQLAKGDIRFKKMVKQIDKYWSKLFCAPIEVETDTGIVMIQPQRTNNMLEQFFREIKRDSRKKTGISSLSKTLKTMMANTPLVKNLNNPEYVEILLDGKKNLAERFSKIDIAFVRATLQQEDQATKKYPKGMVKIFKIHDLPVKIGQAASKKNKNTESNQLLRS